MTRLLNYFLNGVILSAPVALTLYVCWRIFTAVDSWLNFPIPGVGFLATIALITLVGFLATNFLAKRLLAMVESLMKRVPLIRFIYSAIRDVLGAFVGEKKKFGQPVLITLDPGAETKAIGFLTRESLEEIGIADHVTVYLPQSYNFAGQMIVVPKERVTRLETPSSKVLTFVVSGGVAEVGE